MTDNEIIKAIEYCLDSSNETCEFCPFRMYCERDSKILRCALDIIYRQKAENEQLQHKYDLAVAEREANVKGFTEQLTRLKTDVAREIFAVTDILGTYNPAMYDELKKKYTGAGEEPFSRDHENADVVEVVRCKDCAVPHNRWTGCPNLNGLIPPPDFYCAKGERRADNE